MLTFALAASRITNGRKRRPQLSNYGWTALSVRFLPIPGTEARHILFLSSAAILRLQPSMRRFQRMRASRFRVQMLRPFTSHSDGTPRLTELPCSLRTEKDHYAI